MNAWTVVIGIVTLGIAYGIALWRIAQIHTLVNSRLSSALAEIRSLKKELGRPPDDE
jgi:hypothetical protein